MPVESIQRVPREAIAREWACESSTGKGVKVAIIDSGVDAAHPAVGGVDGYISVCEENERILYDTEPHDDAYGHGTACAGIIRALAPECEIYSVKVLGSGLVGRGVILTAGLQWALDNGMHVCNLSLGTTRKDFFTTLHGLADTACSRNVILVAAANNRPVPSFPSAFPSVISVAAHDVEHPHQLYCNPQPSIEFGAMGINVRVAWLNNDYIQATGNSFAAPHITGLVTRIFGRCPELTSFEMKAVLRALAVDVSRGAALNVARSAAPTEVFVVGE